MSASLEYMTTLGVLLGGDKNDTRNYMYEVLDFQMAIANVSMNLLYKSKYIFFCLIHRSGGLGYYVPLFC